MREFLAITPQIDTQHDRRLRDTALATLPAGAIGRIGFAGFGFVSYGKLRPTCHRGDCGKDMVLHLERYTLACCGSIRLGFAAGWQCQRDTHTPLKPVKENARAKPSHSGRLSSEYLGHLHFFRRPTSNRYLSCTDDLPT